jgi:hypothetical protein
MKTTLLFSIMILTINCGQPKKELKTEEKNENIASDTLSRKTEKQFDNTDTISYFDNLDKALLVPKKVIHLTIEQQYQDATHLPSKIGELVNLKTLQLACMSVLEDLPTEIGQLQKLEKLIIDNGNGCQMNIALPTTIGQLKNLKELVLYGALDARDIEHHDSIQPSKIKNLPEEIGNLKNLVVLNLGRNGIQSVPNQIASLTNLKVLRLDYNDILEIPSFISNFKNLQELDLTGNQNIELPNSLSELKNLKVYMKNNSLKIKVQKELKNRFPNITFIFENEYVGGNEEPTQ